MSDLWEEEFCCCLCWEELLRFINSKGVFWIMAEDVVLKIEKPSKDIGKLKEGDKFFINGKEMRVDKQFLFQDHGKMKEMIVEIFNPENEREYQIRYFDDQVDSSIEIYELIGEFEYVKREPKSVSW